MTIDKNWPEGNPNEYFDNLYKLESKEFKKEVIESLRAGWISLSMFQSSVDLLILDLKMFKISSFLFTVNILRKIGEKPSEKLRRVIAEMYRINYNEISEEVEESFRGTKEPDNVIPYELFKKLRDKKKKKDSY